MWGNKLHLHHTCCIGLSPDPEHSRPAIPALHTANRISFGFLVQKAMHLNFELRYILLSVSLISQYSVYVSRENRNINVWYFIAVLIGTYHLHKSCFSVLDSIQI